MSHVIVDGRTLTEAERIKLMADMEREEVSRHVDAVVQRADEILQLHSEYDKARSRAAQLRADLYAAEARIGEIRGKFEKLGVEWRT